MCSTFVRCRWLRGRRQQKQHYSFPISSCYPLLIQLVLSVSISLFLRISLSLSRCQPFFRMSFVTVISQCHRFNEIVLFCNRKCVILYSSSYCRFADTNRSNECKSVCQLRMITHTHRTPNRIDCFSRVKLENSLLFLFETFIIEAMPKVRKFCTCANILAVIIFWYIYLLNGSRKCVFFSVGSTYERHA